MGVGDALRGVAQKIDPSPSETMVAITQDGKDRGAQLVGKTKLGLILSHLTEFSPQSVSEIANATELHTSLVLKEIKAYPAYFTVRTR